MIITRNTNIHLAVMQARLMTLNQTLTREKGEESLQIKLRVEKERLEAAIKAEASA